MPASRTQSAQLAELVPCGRSVELRLLTDEGVEHVIVPLPQAAAAALPHVWALCAGSGGCARRDGGRCPLQHDGAMSGLLLRTVAALGGRADCVVVRSGDDPAFRLRVVAAGGEVQELDLGVLDAVGLLAGGHLPLELERVAAGAWEAALRGLLEGRETS